LRKNAEVPAPTTLSGRELVEALSTAHRESVVLVRSLLIAQEVADACMVEADAATREAASHPRDREANELAADARTRAAFADAEELRATERWATHLGEVQDLLTMAGELFPDDRLSAWPGGSCGTTLPSRKRSRGHCAP
jgi:hypothetical protein